MGNPSETARSDPRPRARRNSPPRVECGLLWPGLGLLLLCIGLSSCGGAGDAASQDRDQQGIRKTFKRGPVTVELHVDRRELTLADQLNLTIEATAGEEYEVELPSVGEKLEQFGIVDYQTEAPVLVEDNRTRLRRTYLLEPFLSGDYTIPEMTVRFWKKAEAEKKYELETEALSVRVTSLLPEQLSELKLHDIQAPVNLPRSSKAWIVAGGVLGVVGLSIGIWALLRKRRKGVEAEAPIAAHELAYEQLETLIAEDLPGKGRLKLFYQKLSGILRHYIENRFTLHAPEQTTEEFLGSLRDDHHLSEIQKGALRQFLGHCDLVKFAEHRPETSDIQGAFDSCKNFIFETEGSATTAPIRASGANADRAASDPALVQ